MRYQVVKSTIDLIGRIWMPPIVCAMTKELREYDLENIGEWTRENVEDWLARNSGDFQEVIDFRADFSRNGRDWVSEWAEEESEFTFGDCMFPSED